MKKFGKVFIQKKRSHVRFKWQMTAKEKKNLISYFKHNTKKITQAKKKPRGRIPSLHWTLQLGKSIYKKNGWKLPGEQTNTLSWYKYFRACWLCWLDLSPNSGLKMLRADISVFLPAFSSKPSWKTAWSSHDHIANIVQEKITAMYNKLLFNQEEIQFVFVFFF